MRGLAALSLLLLAGCASNVPAPIREAPEAQPGVSQVRANPSAYAGQRVRWGGEIVAVANEAEATVVEIVERPLYGDGEPRRVDGSQGRFRARIAGFLDPAVYASGRRLTVAGTLEGVVAGRIGDYEYRFPVVAVSDYHLWPEPRPRSQVDDPYWHDAWYPHRYFYPYCPYGVHPRYCW